MSWWMWVLLGVVLLAVEIVTPGGLFALFFGASAILVGGLVALGVEARWLQWLLFAGLGVLLVVALRRRLRSGVSGDPRWTASSASWPSRRRTSPPARPEGPTCGAPPGPPSTTAVRCFAAGNDAA